jgi:phytoene dehydrogenase-like protein
MSKKIVIIGAGIAGLSAGVYSRINGFDTEIFEMHSMPGGLCTAWKRKGFTFDGCIHWLTGSGPNDSFYPLWNELGAIKGRRFVDHDIFQSYTNKEGRKFNLYTNVERLESHMLLVSPSDEALTKRFCNWIRKFSRFKMSMNKAFELYGFIDMIKMMISVGPYMGDINKLNQITIGEFASQFKDPLLKESFEMLFGLPNYPLFSLIATLSLLHNRAGGFPLGGSLEFAKSIEKKYLDLGGKVFYGKKVNKILVTDETIAKGSSVRASGILLEDGGVVSADYVISAADLRTTIDQMLGGKFIEPQLEELFRTVPLAPSSVQVFFGLNRKFDHYDQSASYVFRIDSPVQIGSEFHDRITERNYNYDKSLAPDGKSVISSMFIVKDFPFWENLRKDKEFYKQEKDRILQCVTKIFEQRYPGFGECIETADVVTPLTYIRYAGVYKGTYMTWVLSGDNSKKFRMVKKTLPGLSNFYLSGMWIMPPGGVPTGAKTSRDILELICKKEKQKFLTAATSQLPKEA